jgi:hypothetical protein
VNVPIPSINANSIAKEVVSNVPAAVAESPKKPEPAKVPIQRTISVPTSTPSTDAKPTAVSKPSANPTAADPAEDAKQKRAMLLKQKLLAEQAKKKEAGVTQAPAEQKPKIVRPTPSVEGGEQKRVRQFGRGRGAQIKVKNPQNQGQGRGKPQNQQ